MGAIGILVMSGCTWLATEVAGKYIFKRTDNKVICLSAGLLVGAAYQLGYAGEGVGWADSLALGYISNLVASLAHDKNIKDVIMKRTADLLKSN